MGKSLPSATRLQDFARVITTSNRAHHPKHVKPGSKTRFLAPPEPSKPPRAVRIESNSNYNQQQQQLRLKMEMEEKEKNRLPLAEVVSDCVKRWFQATLKEAKAGDSAMQVLVGQMYYGGYGIRRDAQKGRAWINKASKSPSSVWKVGDKHPGYNASDSDSNATKADAK